MNPLASTSTSTSTPAQQGFIDSLSLDFPHASNLSREEMTTLLEDEAYFDAWFNTTSGALELYATLEGRLRENIELAQRSEAMRPDLERLRTETAAVFAEALELKARWSHLEAAQADAYKSFAPRAQLNRLRSATSNQEHLSESLVTSFLEGGMDDESFARQYKEIRKVFHRRDISLVKWEEGTVIWKV